MYYVYNAKVVQGERKNKFQRTNIKWWRFKFYYFILNLNKICIFYDLLLSLQPIRKYRLCVYPRCLSARKAA